MTTWKPTRLPRSERDPRPVVESLDRVTRRLGTPPAPVMTSIFSGWAALVGPEVAAHAQPIHLRSGVLTIEVEQPAWATQLRFLSADLLRRAAEMTGGDSVSEVRIRVRPRGRAGGGPRPG